MGFSKEWNRKYNENQQMSIWPWSDLVSYIYRYTDISKHPRTKVLELGCGAGANIRLFQELGADYYAVDGSPTIVAMLKEKFPIYANHIVVGDFTKGIPFDETFDIIVDRAALTHNTTQDIKNTIRLLRYYLSDMGGRFIGIDWFSEKHNDFLLGDVVSGDMYTKYMGEVEGQFSMVGNVHFSSESHLKELFKDFHILVMEEKIVDTVLPVKHKFASWNFVVEKG